MDEKKNKKTNGRIISFRVDEETYQTFKDMAELFEVSTSQLFRDMLEIGASIAKKGLENGNHD